MRHYGTVIVILINNKETIAINAGTLTKNDLVKKKIIREK